MNRTLGYSLDKWGSEMVVHVSMNETYILLDAILSDIARRVEADVTPASRSLQVEIKV